MENKNINIEELISTVTEIDIEERENFEKINDQIEEFDEKEYIDSDILNEFDEIVDSEIADFNGKFWEKLRHKKAA